MARRWHDRLKPSLLDRLTDKERGPAWQLAREKPALFAALNDEEQAAFERLFDIETRRGPDLTAEDLAPFARLAQDEIERLRRVVALEQRRRFERAEDRVLTLEDHKRGVIRDLEWLLNTENLETAVELDDEDEVKTSVLNYGIPGIVGKTGIVLDDGQREALSRQIAAAIRSFEPRLDGRSVRVITVKDAKVAGGTQIAFDIEADLIAEPAPLRLLLRSVVDLENGDARVVEAAG